MKNLNKSTGIKLPPPIFYAIALTIGIALHYFFPITLLSELWQYIIGIILIILSFTIILFVIIQYKKLKTSFDVRKPAKALITDGPNRYSRNPGYFSLTLLYLGTGFVLNNIWVLVLSIPLIFVINLLIIRKEESQLEAIFGKDYLRYKSEVRRWI